MDFAKVCEKCTLNTSKRSCGFANKPNFDIKTGEQILKKRLGYVVYEEYKKLDELNTQTKADVIQSVGKAINDMHVDCRYYSCIIEGIPAAAIALLNRNINIQAVVVNDKEVQVKPFGTVSKPHIKGMGRYVTINRPYTTIHTDESGNYVEITQAHDKAIAHEISVIEASKLVEA